MSKSSNTEVDLIQSAINIAVKNGYQFVPLIKCDTKEEAVKTSKKLDTIIDQYSAKDRTVSVDTKSDSSGHFVTITLTDVMPCGGEVNKYCKNCGIFHFDVDGVSPRELIRIKKEAYGKAYQSIRNKSDA